MVTRGTWGIQLFENCGSKPTTTFYFEPIPRKNRWKLARIRKSSQKSDQCWQYTQMPTNHSFFNFIYLTRPTILQNFTTGGKRWLWYSNNGTGNQYCNPNLRELHKIQLHNLKFDHKNGSPGDFLVQVQMKATQAYPEPVFLPIPPRTCRTPKQKLAEFRMHRMATKQC